MKKFISIILVIAMGGGVILRGIRPAYAQTSYPPTEEKETGLEIQSTKENKVFIPMLINSFRDSPSVEQDTVDLYPITERVSVSIDGTQGNDSSYSDSMTSDGRFITIVSYANNIVIGDTNEYGDVLVLDRDTGEIYLASVASDGTQANEFSYTPTFTSISEDGRFVCFTSWDTNLVDGDTNDEGDVFVHDRETGETTRVSVATDGSQGNDYVYTASISPNGRYVVFDSYASNMVEEDTNDRGDVFVHDRESGETTRISIDSNGNQADRTSYLPSTSSISADSRYIVFVSNATNLVDGDTNGVYDVFVHDMQTGETNRVSVRSDGIEQKTECGECGPSASISADGRFIAFDSYASDLVEGDDDFYEDIFVHDRETGETTLVSVSSEGIKGNAGSWYPVISGDGRYVLFSSRANNLVPGDTNGVTDAFLHDRQTQETRRVSVASYGIEGNGGSYGSDINSDGSLILFDSRADNLVPDDTNQVFDVFVQYFVTEPPPPPTAAFSADVTSGQAPLEVQFNDQSTGIIHDYDWNFGDGNSSSEKNPKHTFTRAGNFTVTLTVTGPGGSDSAQTRIDVFSPPPPPTNTPPDAKNDIAVTNEDVPKMINVIENDIDIDGNLDPSSLRIERNPFFGQVALATTPGYITYSPDPNFNGSDSFTYRICDTERKCDIAEVLVRIYAVNDAPILIIQDPQVTVQVGEKAINSGKVIDIERDAVSLTASMGEITTNSDGTWSWSFIPNIAKNYTVKITADDGHEGITILSFVLKVILPPEVYEEANNTEQIIKNNQKEMAKKNLDGLKEFQRIGNIVSATILAIEIGIVIGTVGFAGPVIIWHAVVHIIFEVLMELGIRHLEGIIADPPDPNYTELVPFTNIQPILPPNNDSVRTAWAAYLTSQNEEVIYMEGFLTSFERFQGALIAKDPEYILLQALAVNEYLELWSRNQTQLAFLLRNYAIEFETFVEPNHEQIAILLEQLSNQGFNNEWLTLLNELGLSSDEIQSFEDLFANIESPSTFDTDGVRAFRERAEFLEELVIPALEKDMTEMTKLVELLETNVEVTLPNDPPLAEASDDYVVDEGGYILLDGSASDTNGGPLTFEWDLNNDGIFETFGENPPFFAINRDGPGNQTVVLQVCDMFDACDTDEAIIEIINVDPTVSAGQDQTVYRTDPVTVSGTWADPAEELDNPYTWNWDLDGDGTSDKTGSANYGETISETTSFPTEGKYTLTFDVADKDGGTGSDNIEITVLNRPPVCSEAKPSIDNLWSPNHKFVSVDVLGVTDPEGDAISINIDSIFQDEPVDSYGDGSFTPDGRGVGNSTAELRVERAGGGNGRVYHVSFTADDGHGGTCSGKVLVGVPKSSSPYKASVDEGPLYDSTKVGQ